MIQLGESARLDSQALAQKLYPVLTAAFSPALLQRALVIPYLPLDAGDLRLIVQQKLAEISRRFAGGGGSAIDFDDAVVDLLARQCGSGSGARNLGAALTHGLLPELSEQLLPHVPGAVERARVGIAAGKLAFGISVRA
jgi:type VI secretion system protein VasG